MVCLLAKVDESDASSVCLAAVLVCSHWRQRIHSECERSCSHHAVGTSIASYRTHADGCVVLQNVIRVMTPLCGLSRCGVVVGAVEARLDVLRSEMMEVVVVIAQVCCRNPQGLMEAFMYRCACSLIQVNARLSATFEGYSPRVEAWH